MWCIANDQGLQYQQVRGSTDQVSSFCRTLPRHDRRLHFVQATLTRAYRQPQASAPLRQLLPLAARIQHRAYTAQHRMHKIYRTLPAHLKTPPVRAGHVRGKKSNFTSSKIRINHPVTSHRIDPTYQFWQTMISLWADNNINPRCPADNLHLLPAPQPEIAFICRPSWSRTHQVGAVAEFGKYFFRGFSRIWQVFKITMSALQADVLVPSKRCHQHPVRVIYIHLTAIGFDKKFLVTCDASQFAPVLYRMFSRWVRPWSRKAESGLQTIITASH